MFDHALEESGLLHKLDLVGCITDAGKEHVRNVLGKISSNAGIIRAKSAFIDRFQSRLCDDLTPYFQKAAECEKIIASIDCSGEETDISPVRPSDPASIATAQLYFDGAFTKYLNLIPFLVTIVAAFKIYVAPIMALALPLLLFVMPYVLLNGLMGVQIPWETYKKILFQFILGINPAEPWSLKQVVKLFWGLLSFGQGIFQPFMTAYNTYKIRATYHHYAEAIKSYSDTIGELSVIFGKYGLRVPYLPPVPTDPLVRVQWWKEEEVIRKHYRELLGYYDMLYAFGHNRSWRPVVIGGCATVLHEFHDYSIEKCAAVKSTMTLGGHSLLTGPNRGGKSSIMRGILQNILCAQAFGVTYGAEQVVLGRPYKKIYTRLVSKDAPGSKSLFESDVEFAYDVLRGSTPDTLIMIDELFHSTNPGDAEKSARYFLGQLWRKKAVHSLISTHIFGLLESGDLPSNVKKYCCRADVNSDGSLKYHYRCEEGLCMVSSVGEVWASVRSSQVRTLQNIS